MSEQTFWTLDKAGALVSRRTGQPYKENSGYLATAKAEFEAMKKAGTLPADIKVGGLVPAGVTGVAVLAGMASGGVGFFAGAIPAGLAWEKVKDTDWGKRHPVLTTLVPVGTRAVVGGGLLFAGSKVNNPTAKLSLYGAGFMNVLPALIELIMVGWMGYQARKRQVPFATIEGERQAKKEARKAERAARKAAGVSGAPALGSGVKYRIHAGTNRRVAILPTGKAIWSDSGLPVPADVQAEINGGSVSGLQPVQRALSVADALSGLQPDQEALAVQEHLSGASDGEDNIYFYPAGQQAV